MLQARSNVTSYHLPSPIQCLYLYLGSSSTLLFTIFLFFSFFFPFFSSCSSPFHFVMGVSVATPLLSPSVGLQWLHRHYLRLVNHHPSHESRQVGERADLRPVTHPVLSLSSFFFSCDSSSSLFLFSLCFFFVVHSSVCHFASSDAGKHNSKIFLNMRFYT